MFKDYIRTIITHRNQYNNLTYAEDPTIFAYETGNELLGPVWGDMNSPAAWVQDIAKYVKSLAPQKLVGMCKRVLDSLIFLVTLHTYPV